jgi:hypothetical protein
LDLFKGMGICTLKGKPAIAFLNLNWAKFVCILASDGAGWGPEFPNFALVRHSIVLMLLPLAMDLKIYSIGKREITVDTDQI